MQEVCFIEFAVSTVVGLAACNMYGTLHSSNA